MTKNQVIALFLGTVSCQTGSDLLFAETQSTVNGQGQKEFTKPMDPRGEKVFDGKAQFGEATEVKETKPAQQGKTFSTANGPAMTATPISAPISWNEENWDMSVSEIAEKDEWNTAALDMASPFLDGE